MTNTSKNNKAYFEVYALIVTALIVTVSIIAAMVIAIAIPSHIYTANQAQIRQQMLLSKGVQISLHDAYWMSEEQFKYFMGGTPIQRQENNVKLEIK